MSVPLSSIYSTSPPLSHDHRRIGDIPPRRSLDLLLASTILYTSSTHRENQWTRCRALGTSQTPRNARGYSAPSLRIGLAHNPTCTLWSMIVIEGALENRVGPPHVDVICHTP
jgi:hypothetical protein